MAVRGSTLSKVDADEYRIALKKFSKFARSSEKSAQKALITLGTHTPTGRISKKYG